jgi:hypothetical protein
MSRSDTPLHPRTFVMCSGTAFRVLDKPIVAQLVKKYNPRVHHRVRKTLYVFLISLMSATFPANLIVLQLMTIEITFLKT